MLVRVLGDFEVELHGDVLPLGGPKPRALLALLVAARGRPVSVERLVDQMWGDAPPPQVMGSLQALVAKLRRQVEPGRDARARPEVLVTRPSGYALLLPAGAVDADRFEADVARAGTLAGSEAERLLVGALDLWTGPAFGGVADTSPALAAEARRLEDLRLGAVEQLWSLRLDRGDHARAAAELRTLAAAHPVRERLWGLLALALYRSDRQAEALEVLREVRRHLADELGLDPGTDLRRLEESLLRQDPGLLADPGTARPAPGTGDPAPPGPVLPGRDECLALTRAAVDDVLRGRGRVVLVTGQPGIGKTRLAQAVTEQASAAGLACGAGTWEAEDCPPLWGWTQALAPLLGDGSPLAHLATAGTDAASTTFEVAESLTAALRATGGACLVLDDVHWADPDSHRLLRRVAATLHGVPVLLLVLGRAADADLTPAMETTLAALARLEVVRVPLTGLDAPAVAEHVRAGTGLEVGADVAERLRERTDGNPFFVQETVRALTAAGALQDPDDPAWARVPAGVRDVVRHRLAALPPAVGDVLSTASVLGRVFDADVLEAACDEDGAAVDEALETALAAGLVEEEDVGRYRFRHALVRDAVHEDLPGPARARAHLRAAEAFERQRVGHLDAYAVQLAEHYRLAGPVHARSAWTYAVRAADRAAARASGDDATRLLASAVALQERDPLVSPEEREQVVLAHGRALHRVARTYEAWTPVATAASSALARGDAVRAADALLAITEGLVWSWRRPGEVSEAAIALWRAVLAALPADAEALRVRCTAALAVELLYVPGSGEEAARLVDEALHAARLAGDPGLLVEALNLTHTALHRPDQLLLRVPIADEMVDLCVRRRDDAALAGVLCRRGVDRAELGRWQDALADFGRADELARTHHVAPVLLIAGFALALRHHADGDWDAALAAAQRIDAFASTMSLAGNGIGLAQASMVRLRQGRLPELEPALREAVSWHPSVRDLHALALVEAGRLDEARSALGPWDAQPTVSWDYLWISCTVLRARLWSALGDTAAVADLTAQLTPFADRLAVGGMSSYLFGSVHQALAVLALAAGDHDTAGRHARAALAVHRDLGFGPLAAESERLLGDLPPPG